MRSQNRNQVHRCWYYWTQQVKTIPSLGHSFFWLLYKHEKLSKSRSPLYYSWLQQCISDSSSALHMNLKVKTFYHFCVLFYCMHFITTKRHHTNKYSGLLILNLYIPSNFYLGIHTERARRITYTLLFTCVLTCTLTFYIYFILSTIFTYPFLNPFYC